MKVLHFVNGRCNFDSANGVDKTVYYLTRELARLGHEIHLVCATKKDAIPIEGVEIHQVPPFSPTFICPGEVVDLIESLSPDFGHFHSAYAPENIAVSRALTRSRIPFAVTPNGNCSASLMKRRPWIKAPYKLLLERPYMNRAAFVHSVGDETQIRNYGVTVPVVEALNGIDLETLPSKIEKQSLAEIAPHFAGRFVCVFLGRLDIEQKGLDLLVEAVAMLKSEGVDPAVLLVGPSWKGSRDRLEVLIKEADVEDCFHLHGPAHGEEKFQLVASGDAFIHASRWEGLPFSVVEAMAMSQLCIVTPAADPAGRIRERGAGIDCELSASGVAEGIRRAINLTAVHRQELIDCSSEIVKTDMNWGNIANQISAAYQKYQ